MTVTRDGDQLVFTARGQQNGARPPHIGNGVWLNGGSRLWFVAPADRANELRLEQGAGHYVLRRVR
jgi:hypothetical protein